mgnify:FL=1
MAKEKRAVKWFAFLVFSQLREAFLLLHGAVMDFLYQI